jgi:hypothetical protein
MPQQSNEYINRLDGGQKTTLLSFKGSEYFRNTLLARNLIPYKVEGSWSYQGSVEPLPTTLSDVSPINGPNVSDTVFDEAEEATLMNVYGPAGEIIDGGEMLSSDGGAVSMQQAGTGNLQSGYDEQKGEYGEQVANLQLVNEFFIDSAAVINRFIPDGGYANSYISTSNILPKGNYKTSEYPNFTLPQYGIFASLHKGLFNLFDISTNGLDITSDSYLQQISNVFVSQAFEERVNTELYKYTIGKVNLQAFSDPFSASLLASGQQDLIAKNYTITVPDGVFDQAAFILQRFSGTYVPTSLIEGEYFQTPQRQKTKAGQLIQSVFNKFTKPATPQTGSKKFLNNTGSGQKSVLFENLGYNRFKPEYEQNTTQVGLVIDQVFNKNNSLTNFYVGTETNDPYKISSPVDQVPYDAYGNQTNTIVLGPDKLAKEYEGTDLDKFKFGLASLPYDEDQDPTGGFTWVSTKNSSEAGKFVGPGGEQFGLSPTFNGNVGSKFSESESTSVSFKAGSILDETQRIIESAPASGAKRLVHVGNAMNQISKVFNDGYKELTKGSKVKRFVNKNGIEVGQEYGRVFAKDIPYLTFGNLQSTIANTSGLETNGNIRRFSYSVLDSTYNLNIAPTYGDSSTNIKDGKVKKYMFSIENLAWRNTPEFEDLPACEKGPNGGRIMWFPPYNLNLGQETSNPKFNPTSFLGRPEPIYTYENTERGGSISWDIIVDHPSVGNLIVKKELERVEGNTATQIMASFFAGLKKYDIYDLATKYSTLDKGTINSVYEQVLGNGSSSNEDIKQTLDEVGPEGGTEPVTNEIQTDLSKYVDYAFYFDSFYGNESTKNYEQIYQEYDARQADYLLQNPADETPINIFFDDVLDSNYNSLNGLRASILDILEQEKGIVEITFSATQIFGELDISTELSQWIPSVKLFFTDFVLPNGKSVKDYVGKNLIFKPKQGAEASTEKVNTTIPKSELGLNEINCLENNGENTTYSLKAMACRSIKIQNILFTPQEPKKESSGTGSVDEAPNQDSITGLKPNTSQSLDSKLEGISKRILRKLLTECNYFETIKSTDSFLFETIKNKFKFFNPAFHAITPEGLNARLVFLNQCVRPGRTIPTKQESTEVFADSFNTNFGTPPVLILRVGDFYNTKIIPESLSIQYEPLLDLNPEGIGVQPMIAKITLGYKMIGGHGLAGPVEKLQNALSFNYYANTEMYDERADATESTEAIDKAVLNAIRNEEPLPPVTSVNEVNELGTTFGDIVNSTPSENGVQTGEISYKNFFNTFIDINKNYMNSVVNNFVSFCNEFNLGVWYQVNHDRFFKKGYYNNLNFPNTNSVSILGKPSGWEGYLNSVNELLKDKLYDFSERIIANVENDGNISGPYKNVVLSNYVNYLGSNLNTNFINVSTYIQDLSGIQLDVTTYMEKMDFISFSGDGKILGDGSAKIYSLTGGTAESGTQNTLEQFQKDYQIIMSGGVGTFYSWAEGAGVIPNSGITSGDVSTFNTKGTPFPLVSDNYAYILLSNIFLDTAKKEDFINQLVLNITEPDTTIVKASLQIVIQQYVDLFTAEKNAEKSYLDSILASPEYLSYKNWYPETEGGSMTQFERKMSFETGAGTELQKTSFSNIKSTQNTNNDKDIFNGKKEFNS